MLSLFRPYSLAIIVLYFLASYPQLQPSQLEHMTHGRDDRKTIICDLFLTWRYASIATYVQLQVELLDQGVDAGIDGRQVTM